MADVATDPTGEGKEKVPKKGMLTGKNKWYVVGGLAIIAVLVFVFVRKSNASAAGGTSASDTGTTSSLDPATESALQTALQSQGQQALDTQTAQGPAGSAGPAGPAGPPSTVAGPAGPTGKTGPAGAGTVFYTVKPGDTLTSIATRLHTQYHWTGTIAQNASNIANNNRGIIGSSSVIHPGQRLVIP